MAMAQNDWEIACFEQIPGVEVPVDVLVREGFWYVAALVDEGWKIASVTRAGVTAISPEGLSVAVSSRKELVDERIATFARHVLMLAQLDDVLVGQLAALVKWRTEAGVVVRPCDGSTVSEDEIFEGMTRVIKSGGGQV